MLLKAAGLKCVLTGRFFDCWGSVCHVKEKQKQSCVAISLGWYKAGCWCSGARFGLWKWRLELWSRRGKEEMTEENNFVSVWYQNVTLLLSALTVPSPVQRFWLWGRLLTGGGPSCSQCCACHWRVLLWLWFPGWDQLQPSPARFSPSQRLSLWRGWPR